MKALLVVFVLSLGTVAYAGDTPDTADGKAYLDDGTAAFKRGEFAAASRAFAAGYEVEKWNGFLFAWAQAERKAGNCEKAIQLYSRFIFTKPSEEATGHALGWIKECGGTYVEPPPEPVKPPIEPVKPPIEPVKPPIDPPKPKPPEPPGFQHKLAIGLGAGALVAGSVAVWGLYRSNNDFDRAAEIGTYKDVARLRDRAEDRLLIARVSIGVGIGLATATVLRVVLQDRTPRTEVVPTGNGVALRRAF